MIIPKSADVIIIGGGVMGASTAFYLARRRNGSEYSVLFSRAWRLRYYSP